MTNIYKKIIYVLLLAIALPFFIQAKTLNVQRITQEQSNWCWAGTSICVLKYYGDTQLTQCAIANFARTRSTKINFGTADCCSNPSGACNQSNYNWGVSGSIEDILKNASSKVSISVQNTSNSVSQSTVAAAFNDNRPIIIRVNSGGHFIVLHGLEGNTLYYMDPLPNEGKKYQTFSTSQVNGRNWTHTQICTTKPTATTTYYRVKNRGTGLFLDGYGRTANGSNVAQYANTTHVNAQWLLESAGSYFKLKNRGTGLYLDGMGRTANGSICGQWSGNTSYNQQWQRVSISGYYQFKNRGTGLFLDGYGRTANGSDAAQHASTTHVNSQWTLETASGGSGGGNDENGSDMSLESKNNEISIYPNPADNQLNFVLPEKFQNDAIISIYDYSGKKVYSGISSANLSTIDISSISSGIFIFSINNGQEVISQKFTKK